jgi:hypothetical protein
MTLPSQSTRQRKACHVWESEKKNLQRKAMIATIRAMKTCSSAQTLEFLDFSQFITRND